MTKSNYEAIVIGSGATGGIAALTLAEAGVKVIVIEAGPYLSPEKAFGTEPANSLNRIIGILNGSYKQQAQHPGFWKANPILYANEKQNPYSYPKERPFIWTQGRQIGGRSLTWGGITLRLSDNEFKPSKIDGYGKDWPINYRDLEPHYTSIEKRFGIYGSKDYLDFLPDGEYSSCLSFTKAEEYFAKTVQEKLSYKVINSRGFGPKTYTAGSKWPVSSSPGSSLKLAMATGNITILANHMAESLVMNKARDAAEGVIVVNKHNKERQKINGKLIILSASTIQSLRFLLSSEDSNSENGFIDPSGKLGCNLMDHVSICRFFSLPKDKINQTDKEEIKELSGAGSFFVPFNKKALKKTKNSFIRSYGLWGGINRFEPPSFLKKKPNTYTGFLIGHGEVLPKESNKVTLSNKYDLFGIQAPHIDMSWGENEYLMVEDMKEKIKSCVTAAGGEESSLTELIRIPIFESIIKNAVAIQDKAPPPGYYIHEVGGAPMGSNESSSVLDRYNRLWRCPNVLVVDGSAWPTSAWQSPTLTMMAITRRACLHALKNWNA